MKTRRQINDDLQYILTYSLCTGTVRDELALLRIAISRYRENGNDAEEAIAWSAGQLANSITSNHGKHK